MQNKPVVTLIERNDSGLKTDGASKTMINLVGHKDAVCSSRFNPLLFHNANNSDQQAKNPKRKKLTHHPDSHKTVVALGDRKGYLTVWVSGTGKPVFKTQISPVKSMITDLSWGGGVNSGRTLFVSTMDGTVACIDFSESELGKPMSRKERNEILRTKYGDEVWEGVVKVANGVNGGNKNDLDVAESSFQVSIEGENSQNSQNGGGININNNKAAFASATTKPRSSNGSNIVASPTKTPAETLKNQVVTKTKKGKVSRSTKCE